MLYINVMKNWTLILLFCFSAIYAKAPRDTVYVEQIIRDIVYIPIKFKTDTVYIQEMTATQTKKRRNRKQKIDESCEIIESVRIDDDYLKALQKK